MVLPRPMVASKPLAVLCINGLVNDAVLSRVPGDADAVLVAVDGGLDHALALADTHGMPDYLVGDLDSVDAERVSSVAANGHTRIVRHPAEKNETDLELALLMVEAAGIDHVVIVGLSGGRLDHVLGNVLLLAARDWRFTIDFLSVDGDGHLLTPERPWQASLPDQTVASLLPLSPEVSGVTTTGFYYPLQQATLKLGTPRGMSNVVNAAQSTVSLKSGKLLLVVPPQAAD